MNWTASTIGDYPCAKVVRDWSLHNNLTLRINLEATEASIVLGMKVLSTKKIITFRRTVM